MYIHPKAFMFSTECFTTWPDYFRIFSGFFEEIPYGDIPWNVREHSPESFATFPEYLTTFPGI